MPDQGGRFKVVPEERRSTSRFLARMLPGARAGANRGLRAARLAGAG